MGQLADALKRLIDNPDDLSTLPQLVSQVEQVESNEEMYQGRIKDLQDINRSYLAQIPIPGQEQTQEPEGDPEPTLDDAKQHIINSIGGNK